jgi:hypothetical protein
MKIIKRFIHVIGGIIFLMAMFSIVIPILFWIVTSKTYFSIKLPFEDEI